jgi:hypothetical protein
MPIAIKITPEKIEFWEAIRLHNLFPYTHGDSLETETSRREKKRLERKRREWQIAESEGRMEPANEGV